MATTEDMTAEQHLRKALEFLEHSSQEFDSGDALQGSEKLWGAAAHSVMAIAMQRGWKFGSHYAIGDAAERLAEERADPLLASDFAVAEKFHANFYHDFMEERDIGRDRPAIDRFVRRLAAIAGEDPR